MNMYKSTFTAIAVATGLALSTPAPAHAGFWSDLGSAVSGMFSGAGISSGYTTSFGGTTTAPLVVTKFPPSRLSVTRQQLLQRQQVRSNQFNLSYWLLTGIKVPPAKVVMQGSATPTYTPGGMCHGSGCNGG